MCLLGCDNEKNNDSVDSAISAPNSIQSASAQPLPSDGIDGRTILSQSSARYAAADSYQDQAVLYLTYRLEGRRIQEPHPFSTSWEKGNRLTSKIFNGQVHCDGMKLGCYIFDIGSANLDNQQLLLPVANTVPITRLYDDSIARHFLGGYSELPLDEKEKDLPPKLIPPPISLLTGQLPFGWIQGPEQVERLPDETLDKVPCYVLRTLYAGSTADIWINQKTGLLVQMSLPLRLMIREVLTTGEIEDVKMLVKFHDARFDENIDDNSFRIPVRPDATVVRNFVSIPEPMPSELIGKVAPEFQLFKPNGDSVEQSFFSGRTTALLWLGGESSVDALQKFAQIGQDLPISRFKYGAVYSDFELADPKTGSVQPNKNLSTIATSTELPIYYDQQLQASSRLQIKAIPTVIVMDDEAKIQFARALSDEDWKDDLVAALQRVSQGEDVATEMIEEYQRYIDEYHQQLVLASGKQNSSPEKSADDGTTGRLIANGYQHSKLKTTLAWSNLDFKQAGNLLVDDVGNVFVFDGYRTVVELNAVGQAIARHELEMPEQEAVSCLRVAEQDSNSSWATYSVQGQRIYLFDSDWELTAVLPDPEFKHDGIRDAQFTDVDGDGSDELVVAFAGTRGIYQFDLQERTTKQISKSATVSLAKLENGLAFCNPDELGFVASEPQLVEASGGISFHKLIPVGTEVNGHPCIIGRDKNQTWFVAGLESNGKISWQQSVGPQLFESQIEPVATAATVNGMHIIAIADVENRVTIISQYGELLGQYTETEPICGIGLAVSQRGIQLFLTTANSVKSFDIESNRLLKPVSNQKN